MINTSLDKNDLRLKASTIDFMSSFIRYDKALEQCIQSKCMDKIIELSKKSNEAHIIASCCTLLGKACENSEFSERLADDEELLRKLVSYTQMAGDKSYIKDVKLTAYACLSNILQASTEITVSTLHEMGLTDQIIKEVNDKSNHTTIFGALVVLKMIALYAVQDGPKIFKRILESKVYS